MTKKSDAPAIRFKGFSDAWEQRKLEDYLTVSAEKNTGNIYGRSDVLSVSGDYGIVNQIEFQGRSFAGASVSNYGVVQTGDVVYTKSPLNSNPYGIIKTNKGKPGIISTLYAVYHPKENAFSDFIQVYFEQHARMNNYMHPLVNKGAKNDMKVSAENALKGPVCFPSRIEQESISAFFSVLDNLITLHQRKFEKLTNVKKSMLEKMFPQNGSSYPEIRFKGFTDPWEQRKLGEMGQTYTGLSGKTKDDFGHGQARFVTYMNVFSNPISNPEMTEPIEIDPKQNEVEVGDVFFTTSSETPEEVGMSSILLEKRGKTYLNSFCFGFRPSEKIDSYYLAYMLRSESTRAKIILLAQGISRYNISKNKVMEIAVSLPSLDEQKMIGQYFSQLDNLITLHQRKCVFLFGFFQAFISMIFTASTFSWEQRKFSELVQIERGGSPRPIGDFITDAPNGLNWVKIGDAPTQGNYITKTAEKIRPEGLSKTREVHPGDLILSNSMSFGKPYIMGIDGCIHDGWLLIRNTYGVFDLTFLCHLLGTPQMLSQYRSLAAGSTVNNLNKELVGNTYVTIPSITEQRVLGAYLEQLDNLITLHQRKFEKLTNVKKSMLEKMFPQNGSSYPEIRFKGFTDPWEQRKLGELVDVCSGRDYKHLSEGTIPVYGTGGYMLSVNDALSYDRDAIGIGRKGTIDRPYILKAPFWTVDTLFYAIPREKVDLNYAFDIFQNIDWKKKDESTGVPSLSKTAINDIDVLAPKHDEQQIIGQFFAAIDNLITLHQRKGKAAVSGCFLNCSSIEKVRRKAEL